MDTQNQEYAGIPRAAHAFYEGMAQATREAHVTFIERSMPEFAKRGIQPLAEKTFAHRHSITKSIKTIDGRSTNVAHPVPRFDIEYFAVISAMNLYYMASKTEILKAELINQFFFNELENTEWEWLGLYDATLPNMQAEIGVEPGKWRASVIQTYLHALQHKSGLDDALLVATRLFLARHNISKEAGVEAATPALTEACMALLARPTLWMGNYVKYNRI